MIPQKMPSILVVDDNDSNLYLLQILLSSSGYAVETALNGELALEISRQNPPDLIISDILCRSWMVSRFVENGMPTIR